MEISQYMTKIQPLHLPDLWFNQRLDILTHCPNYDMVGAFTQEHTLELVRQTGRKDVQWRMDGMRKGEEVSQEAK